MSLGKINDYLSMKASITIRNGKEVKQPSHATENIFEYQGKDYVKYNLYPTISLDIQSDVEKEVFNTSNTCQLSQKDIFEFLTKAKNLLNNFYRVKELFVYKGEELIVNKEIANTVQEIIITRYANILLRPVVVTDPKTNQQYEGVCMMFRQYANYVMMTIHEFTYLIHRLDKLDLDMLSLLLYNTAMSTKKIIGSTSTKNQLPGGPQTYTGGNIG